MDLEEVGSPMKKKHKNSPESRLSDILCCVVCLDLPASSVMQVMKYFGLHESDIVLLVSPQILSTSNCEFYGARSCTYACKTIPLALTYPFTKQIVCTFIVSRIIDQHLVVIRFTSFSRAAYKPLPSIKNTVT